jgi:hypothetical protein
MEPNEQNNRPDHSSDASDTRSVFLSYRRQFASFEARAVYQHLQSNNFNVFLDALIPADSRMSSSTDSVEADT